MTELAPVPPKKIRNFFVLVWNSKTKGRYYLTPSGNLTTLRVHASQYTLEDASDIAREICEEHKGEYNARAFASTRKVRP